MREFESRHPDSSGPGASAGQSAGVVSFREPEPRAIRHHPGLSPGAQCVLAAVDALIAGTIALAALIRARPMPTPKGSASGWRDADLWLLFGPLDRLIGRGLKAVFLARVGAAWGGRRVQRDAGS